MAEQPSFRSIPKVELHLHLGGSYPLDYLFSIATAEQKQELEKNLAAISRKVDYHEVFAAFNVIAQIVNTEEKAKDGIEALCRELAEDGIVYAEIRTGLKDLGNGAESYLQTVLRGLQNSENFQSRLLLSLKRASSLAEAKLTVDLALKYKDRGVVGIDITGNSTIGRLEAIIPELKRAKEGGLFLTIHMGEAPGELDQIEILESLNPDRIGHAVFLTPEAKDWILTHRVPIEVCPTSSVLVQMVEKYQDHPGLLYSAQGHPIVICTDDPLIFQNSLSSEFQTLRESGLSHEQLHQIAASSFDYAFLSQEEKLLLRKN